MTAASSNAITSQSHYITLSPEREAARHKKYAQFWSTLEKVAYVFQVAFIALPCFVFFTKVNVFLGGAIIVASTFCSAFTNKAIAICRKNADRHYRKAVIEQEVFKLYEKQDKKDLLIARNQFWNAMTIKFQERSSEFATEAKKELNALTETRTKLSQTKLGSENAEQPIINSATKNFSHSYEQKKEALHAKLRCAKLLQIQALDSHPAIKLSELGRCTFYPFTIWSSMQANETDSDLFVFRDAARPAIKWSQAWSATAEDLRRLIFDWAPSAAN